MSGYTLITKWFAQRMEEKLVKDARRFDKEMNAKILEELTIKCDELHTAYGTGIGVTEAAANVGICALAIAHNVDRKIGETEQSKPAPKLAAVEDDDPFADLEPSPKKISSPNLALPKRKRGRKSKKK